MLNKISVSVRQDKDWLRESGIRIRFTVRCPLSVCKIPLNCSSGAFISTFSLSFITGLLYLSQWLSEVSGHSF